MRKLIIMMAAILGLGMLVAAPAQASPVHAKAIAVLYVNRDYHALTTTVRARDYVLAQGSGPNVAVQPEVRFELFRDGHCVLRGWTTGGWAPAYVWNGVENHRYSVRFSGNGVVRRTHTSVTLR